MSDNKEINKVKKNRSYNMALFICALVFGIGIFMLLLNIPQKNYKIIPITVVYTLLMGFTFLILRKTKKMGFFYVNAIALIFLLEVTFIFTGGTEGFGILWIAMVPIFSVYILTFDYYLFLNAVVFFILVLGLWLPLKNFCYNFGFSFSVRYPILYLIESIFGLFLKRRISITEETMEKQNDLLEKELDQAAIIQENFYNHSEQKYEGWDLGYILKPMAKVTGDLYDIYDRDSKLDGIGVFDISGHGISSGLVTMLVKNIIQQEFYEGLDYTLDQVLELIDGRVIEEKGDIENYLTGILVRIKDDILELVNAGHPYPLIYRNASESFEMLQKDTQSRGAIGLAGLTPVFITQEIKLKQNDEIILFTDGIFDIKNAEGKTFTMANLTEILQYLVNLPAKLQIERLMEKIDEFRGEAEQTDDLTVLILKKED